MHMEDLDLNLLRLFEAVHRHRSVSRAALELGLSQPAVSQGLSRLRAQLSDALFVRQGRGVSPTAMAHALAPSVERALELMREALHSVAAFEPSATQRTFRMHMSDIGESEFLPGLIEAVHRQAPRARIETRQLEYSTIENALDSGGIDVAFGYLPGVDHTRHQRLFMERYVVLSRHGHPTLTERPSLRCLSELDYVVVSQHTETVRLLHAMQLQRNIRLSTPHFLVIPAILSQTDLAVVLPLRIASKFARAGRFCVAHPRWGQPEFEVGLHWSQRSHHDPAQRWLRAIALDLFTEEPAHAGPAARPARRAASA